MKIQNYDIQDENKDFVQLKSFMPNRCFRMLICAPSGGGKTNLLLDMTLHEKTDLPSFATEVNM